MTISIITTTYNRAEQLGHGLRSILSQAGEHDSWEFVIVDDGSQDNTKEVVEALKKEYQWHTWKYIYLDHPEPRISCIPHNIGIKQATGEVLIFTEPECLHPRDSIKKLTTNLIVNPNEIPLATQIWTMGEKAYRMLTPLDLSHPELILEHKYAQLTDTKTPYNLKAPNADFAITGTNDCYAGVLFACYRKDAIAIGGFDERFIGHGFDDWDFLHRMELYGKTVVHRNDIPVIHLWHEKKYPYNIYDAAEKNGKLSEANIHTGVYEVNRGEDWGKIEDLKT